MTMMSLERTPYLKCQAVRVILSTALNSTPLSECSAQSVNLTLSKRHSTMHPHTKTLFSLLSLSMCYHLLCGRCWGPFGDCDLQDYHHYLLPPQSVSFSKYLNSPRNRTPFSVIVYFYTTPNSSTSLLASEVLRVNSSKFIITCDY